MSDFLKLYSAFSDEQWTSKLMQSVKNQHLDGIIFPGFPSSEIQKQFVGSDNENALQEASVFYSHATGYAAALRAPLTPDSRVLDFGIGWGRIIRFFLKDVKDTNLYGIDVDPDIVSVCRQLNVPANVRVVNALGPTNFPDNYFDLITAYSVFSHLSEQANLAWAEEFARILRPGGILIATTEARRFIQYCASLKGSQIQSDWHKALSQAFPTPGAALADYDAGRFVYASTGGGSHRDSSFYGEAVVSERYLKKNWPANLSIRTFIDDKSKFWQAVFIVQKV